MPVLRTCILLVLIICLHISSATAKEATLAEVISTVEQGYGNLQDLQADFSQVTTLPGLPRPQKGNGQLLLRRPQKGAAQFRFDYKIPQQQIISNGSTLWLYQPAEKQVIIASTAAMLQSGGNLAMSYLTGLGNISKDFTPSFAKPSRDDKGNYLIQLAPHNPTPALTLLKLTISKEAVEKYLAKNSGSISFPVVTSIVADFNGSETRIDYSRIRTNSGVSTKSFEFSPPKGVEIIKQ